jgi:hypothetical protein
MKNFTKTAIIMVAVLVYGSSYKKEEKPKEPNPIRVGRKE